MILLHLIYFLVTVKIKQIFIDCKISTMSSTIIAGVIMTEKI